MHWRTGSITQTCRDPFQINSAIQPVGAADHRYPPGGRMANSLAPADLDLAWAGLQSLDRAPDQRVLGFAARVALELSKARAAADRWTTKTEAVRPGRLVIEGT